jgi:hypothetical protein
MTKTTCGPDSDNAMLVTTRFAVCVSDCGGSIRIGFVTRYDRIGRHGPHTACSVEHSERLVKEYLATEEGSEKRSEIERQYGRTAVLKLVKQYEEDVENRKCITSSTTGCPGCELRVEKSQGCNHVSDSQGNESQG